MPSSVQYAGHLGVVHPHRHASALEVEHGVVDGFAAVLRLKLHRQLASARHHEVCRLVLVAERMPADRRYKA